MSTKCFHCKDNLWDEADYEKVDALEKEIASLKELLERALPKVMDRKYARALDKKDYSEEVQWQKDYDVLLKTTQARREK